MPAFALVADIGNLSDRSVMQQPTALPNVQLPALTQALEASWDHMTSYQGATRRDNPAYGQCYPTSRVVQWFYPEFEIAKGDVWTGSNLEQHFWNVRGRDGNTEWLDLSWKQFPVGSSVRHFSLLDRNSLGDSEQTKARCALLLERVLVHLAMNEVSTSRRGE